MNENKQLLDWNNILFKIVRSQELKMNECHETTICNVRGFFDMDACRGICEARPEGLASKETQQLIVTSPIHSIDELPCLQYTASFMIRYDANTAGLATKT